MKENNTIGLIKKILSGLHLNDDKYIISSNYTGLANRMEALALSLAYNEIYGYQMIVDWPECKHLIVNGAKHDKYSILDKILGKKIRDPSEEDFHSLAKKKILIQRGTYGGPQSLLDSLFLPTARLYDIDGEYRTIINSTFKPHNRPVAGVHIRGGDFQKNNSDTYDATQNRHLCTPIWWYRHIMDMISKSIPDVHFFICGNSDCSEDISSLSKDYPVIQAPKLGTFNGHSEGHAADTDPILDLFSLACCPMILGTPMSTFTHYAANALGSPSTLITPFPITHKKNPTAMRCNLFGKRAPVWFDVCKKGPAASADLDISALTSDYLDSLSTTDLLPSFTWKK